MSFSHYPKYKPSVLSACSAGAGHAQVGVESMGEVPHDSTKGASYISLGQHPRFLSPQDPSPEGAFYRGFSRRSFQMIRPFRAWSWVGRDSQGATLGWYGLPRWGGKTSFCRTRRSLPQELASSLPSIEEIEAELARDFGKEVQS